MTQLVKRNSISNFDSQEEDGACIPRCRTRDYGNLWKQSSNAIVWDGLSGVATISFGRAVAKELSNNKNGVSAFRIVDSNQELYDLNDVYARFRETFISVSLAKSPSLPALSKSLKHIEEAIEDSKQILDYEDGWNGEGVIATDTHTWHNAVRFLIEYSNFVYGKYGVLISKPFIDISNDGGVYIHWETPRGKFLIMFKKEKEDVAYFYGESKEDNIPFKSAIKIHSPAQERIASWMKDYLAI